MSQRFVVQVDADQFNSLARPTQPVAGITELLWNSLDAEADILTVTIARGELDGVDTVTIDDNGHGMTHSDALRDFRFLGGSWKRTRSLSKNGKRPLHGKAGAGRFRAFAIGASVEWSSVATEHDGNLYRTAIQGSLDNSEFTVSDPQLLATGSVGTRVVITRPQEYAHRLLSDTAPTHVLIQLAVYLVKYPQIAITYDGALLDPKAILARETVIDLDPVLGGKAGTPTLRILEWSPDAKTIKPSIVVCDDHDIALAEITDGVDTRSDIAYTAYLAWHGFRDRAADLLLADLGDETLKPILDAARAAVHDYISHRLNDRRKAMLDLWKADRVYPYSGEPTNATEAQERRLFDVVATVAASAVSREPKAAKLSLRLIREALAQPPGALHRVLKEVLELTPQQLEDFDHLLERTTLASIIHTSKVVADRLDFLSDFEAMLFDSEKKDRLLERSQLHRVLANGRTWVFGEEYALAVDDQGLTKVLEAHRALLDDRTPVTDPVTDPAGHTRIVDLMLSKASLQADRRSHLVVELKRPRVRLTQTELAQITNYAVAVTRDGRFATLGVNWDFWLLGDEVDEVVTELTNKPQQPSGLYTAGTSYQIWVRRWAEVLEENRRRLHFYRENLAYAPQDDVELTRLLRRYLPEPEAGSKLSEPAPATASSQPAP
jgi:hypothetical protein